LPDLVVFYSGLLFFSDLGLFGYLLKEYLLSLSMIGLGGFEFVFYKLGF